MGTGVSLCHPTSHLLSSAWGCPREAGGSVLCSVRLTAWSLKSPAAWGSVAGPPSYDAREEEGRGAEHRNRCGAWGSRELGGLWVGGDITLGPIFCRNPALSGVALICV